jgi:hypothetical protein
LVAGNVSSKASAAEAAAAFFLDRDEAPFFFFDLDRSGDIFPVVPATAQEI